MSDSELKKIILDLMMRQNDAEKETFSKKDIECLIKENYPQLKDFKSVLKKNLDTLVISGCIRPVMDPDGYKLIPPDKQKKFKNLNPEAFIFYNLIEKSGDEGIKFTDIKVKFKRLFNPGYNDRQLDNITKENTDLLIKNKLIKQTTKVSENKIKVFLLYDIEFGANITGNIFYDDQRDFETSLVEDIIIKTIKVTESNTKNNTQTSAFDMIQELKTKKSGMKDDEAESVLKAAHLTKRVVYGDPLKPGFIHLPSCPISLLPCCGCDLQPVCKPGNPVNPRDCPYLQELERNLLRFE